jgi:hypothetical protein
MGIHSVQGLVPITNLESTIASATSGANGNGSGSGSGECVHYYLLVINSSLPQL